MAQRCMPARMERGTDTIEAVVASRCIGSPRGTKGAWAGEGGNAGAQRLLFRNSENFVCHSRGRTAGSSTVVS